MADENGAADAAAEPTSAPDPQTDGQQAEQSRPEPQEDKGPRDAVARALKQMDEGEAEPAKSGEAPKPQPKQEAKGEEAKPDEKAKAEEGPPRDEHGRFKAREEGAEEEAKPEQQRQAQDAAPQRFSPEAKAEWEKAPPPVRAEVNRAISELERGIQQYQQAWEPLKPFAELARQHGTDIPTALSHYVGIEQLLAKDPVRGMDQIARNMGMSLEDVAKQVLGQKQEGAEGEQQNSGAERHIRQLQDHIARLEQQMGGVSQTIQQQQQAQRHQQTLSEVEQFAQDHPRFDELADTIAQIIREGRAARLDDAYYLAERLNPAPQQPAAPAAEPPAPQKPRQSLSVSGAPGSGSNPAHRQPPSSAREAVRRALSQTG